MTAYLIKRDNDRAVKFSGELLGATECETGTGTWREFSLYKNDKGGFVCHAFHKTIWQGCSNSSSVKACQNFNDVFQFFGSSDQAQYLYELCGLDYAEEI